MAEAFIPKRQRTSAPLFAYTGNYEIIDDGHGDWRLRLLSSGTLTFTSINGKLVHGIDVFLVGGGGCGTYVSYLNDWAWSGGGGGYTKTHKNVSVSRDTPYTVVVGAGGTQSTGYDGGQSSIVIGGTTYKAAGGIHATGSAGDQDSYSWAIGGNGGSGGGGGGYGGGTGGVDGANASGKGQRTVTGPNGESGTTGEFGDPDAIKYSQGGGAATPYMPNSGNGGHVYKAGYYQNPVEILPSSGIVIIRNHRQI